MDFPLRTADFRLEWTCRFFCKSIRPIENSRMKQKTLIMRGSTRGQVPLRVGWNACKKPALAGVCAAQRQLIACSAGNQRGMMKAIEKSKTFSIA